MSDLLVVSLNSLCALIAYTSLSLNASIAYIILLLCVFTAYFIFPLDTLTAHAILSLCALIASAILHLCAFTAYFILSLIYKKLIKFKHIYLNRASHQGRSLIGFQYNLKEIRRRRIQFVHLRYSTSEIFHGFTS